MREGDPSTLTMELLIDQVSWENLEESLVSLSLSQGIGDIYKRSDVAIKMFEALIGKYDPQMHMAIAFRGLNYMLKYFFVDTRYARVSKVRDIILSKTLDTISITNAQSIAELIFQGFFMYQLYEKDRCEELISQITSGIIKIHTTSPDSRTQQLIGWIQSMCSQLQDQKYSTKLRDMILADFQPIAVASNSTAVKQASINPTGTALNATGPSAPSATPLVLFEAAISATTMEIFIGTIHRILLLIEEGTPLTRSQVLQLRNELPTILSTETITDIDIYRLIVGLKDVDGVCGRGFTRDVLTRQYDRLIDDGGLKALDRVRSYLQREEDDKILKKYLPRLISAYNAINPKPITQISELRSWMMELQ